MNILRKTSFLFAPLFVLATVACGADKPSDPVAPGDVNTKGAPDPSKTNTEGKPDTSKTNTEGKPDLSKTNAPGEPVGGAVNVGGAPKLPGKDGGK